jgi:uncharacterized Zn finger protein
MTTATRPRRGETIDAKSCRLLCAGAVWIEHRDPDTVCALVRGDTGPEWIVTRDGTRWSCTCPFPYTRRPCSHVLAVRTVTDRNTPDHEPQR